MATQASIDAVQKAYIAYYGRAADTTGLNYWADRLDADGGSFDALIDAFGTSAEATALFGGQSATATVAALYQQILGRTADLDGLNYYAGKLTSGEFSAASIAQRIYDGATGTDATLLENKLAVAKAFTAGLDTVSEVLAYSGDAAAASVRTMLATVTATTDAATFDTATTIAALETATVANGETFTLTTGVDALTGTSNNDTFVADNTGTDVTSTADIINGGAGTDTINIFSDGAAASLPQLSSVEIANIYDQDADITLAGTQQASLTQATFTRGDGDLDITVGVNMATVNFADMDVNANDIGLAAAAAATSLNVGLSAVTGGTGDDIAVTGAALDAMTITVSSDSSVGGFDTPDVEAVTLVADADITFVDDLTTTDAAATLTVSGAGDVDLSALDAGFTTVDASALTGALTVELGASSLDAQVTGGAGNDVITANTTDSLSSTDDLLAVDAGAGTDVLVIAETADVNTTADAARYTNFETIRTNDSVNMGLVAGISALQITGGTSETYSNMTATQLSNITFRADNTTATTFTAADASGSSDSVTINLASTTATTNIDLAGIGVDNIETVNFNVTTGTNTTGDSAITFGANLADEVTAINFTGTADTTLDVAANTLDVVAVNIDASGMSGTADFTLTQTSDLVTGSTVTGTANGDTIALGTTTGSTYNGGAGNDTFSTVIATLAATGTNDTVVNGGAGTDTLSITDNGSTATDNHFTFVTGMEKLTYTDGGSVSLTAGGAFNTAFADGVTITAAGMDDAATFTYAGGLYDKATTVAITTSAVGDGAGEDISVTTGDAADSVTITASSYTGTAGDSGSFVVSTAAGDDTIVITTGTVGATTTSETITITAGTGADDITLTTNTSTTVQSAANFVIAAGDSTTAAYDQITGFDVADGTNLAMTLDFAGTGAVSSFSATTDYGSILSHSISNGVVTFDDAAAFSTALVIDSTNIADVLGYLAANTATNDVVAFAWDSNDSGSADATMVFHNGSTDSLVELVGITGVAGLSATLTTTTSDYIAIA